MSPNDPVKNADLPQLTFASTHDLLIQLLRHDYGTQANGKMVVDVPCGSGALSVRMRELGFAVTCSDIDAGNFQAVGFPHIVADLNRPLPFPDNNFDVVVSIAGLQRVCFSQVAICEFWRILKPGGTLYLGVTHHASLKSRIRFLLYGTLGPVIDQPDYRQTLTAPEANFRFPLTYVRVEHLLKHQGFSVQEIHCDPTGFYAFALFPVTALVWTVARLKTMISPTRTQSYPRANTLSMLRSKAYIIVANKNTMPAQ